MRTIDELVAKRHELWAKDKDIQQDVRYRNSIAAYIVDNGYIELFKELGNYPEKFIELFFVVVDKKRKTVPFKLNHVQRKFIDRVNRQKEMYAAGETNGIKFLILKGRQQGFTTVIEAYNLASTLTNKNFAGYVLADNTDNTQTIFADKVKHIYDLSPEKIKPTEKYSNRRELLFQTEDGEGANSSIRVTTAGNKDAGRSKTINFLHISEAAFVDKLKELLTGLQEALTKDAVAFLESTANGYNDFKELWNDDNNWIDLFYEWWETPEYRLRFTPDSPKQVLVDAMIQAPETTDKDAETTEWIYSRCKWLWETKELELHQIHWYYNKWKDKKETIKQEYPCTSREAFLASGRPYFNIENLDRRLSEVEPPIKCGYFEYEYKYDAELEKKLINDTTIKWVDDPKGYIKIYEEPQKRVGYSLGGDTASTGVDANFSQVVDYQYNQKATLEVANDEDLFADQTYCLGRMYNWGMIAMEVNHSTHPTKVLIEREYRNLYMRTTTPDATAEKYSQYNGFRTTSANRGSILGTLRTLVRENAKAIKDETTIKQMMSFVINNKGKPEAEEGKHDDSIMSYAIACHVADQQISKEARPPDVLEGDYLRVELEDMGYNDWEIDQYLNGEEIGRAHV